MNVILFHCCMSCFNGFVSNLFLTEVWFCMIGAIPLCLSTNWNVIQSKHNNIFNNVKLLHVSVTSNHNQADISVHGHDMFSAYSMGSHILNSMGSHIPNSMGSHILKSMRSHIPDSMGSLILNSMGSHIPNSMGSLIVNNMGSHTEALNMSCPCTEMSAWWWLLETET